MRIALNKIASRKCIGGVDLILELHHPGRPRHSTEAAAAHHQPAKPSVQRPHAPPPLLIHPPPQIQHPPARHSAHTIRRNLRSNALHAEAARNAKHERDKRRAAAAGAVSPSRRSWRAKLQAQWAGACFSHSCRHRTRRCRCWRTWGCSAGGEKAETRTRRLRLVLMQDAHAALKRGVGRS